MVVSSLSAFEASAPASGATQDAVPDARADAPTLILPYTGRGVDPASSLNYTTKYTYKVMYQHSGNASPSQTNVVIDGVSYKMTPAGKIPYNYKVGVWYTYNHTFKKFSAADYRYRFEFIAQSVTVKSPAVGDYSGPGVPNDMFPKLTKPVMKPNVDPKYDTDWQGFPRTYYFEINYAQSDGFPPESGYPKLVIMDYNSGAEKINKTMEVDLAQSPGKDYALGVVYKATISTSKSELPAGQYYYYFMATRARPADGNLLTPPYTDRNLTFFYPASYNALNRPIPPTKDKAVQLDIEAFPNPIPAPVLTSGDVDPRQGQVSDNYVFTVNCKAWAPVNRTMALLYYKLDSAAIWTSVPMDPPISYPGNDGFLENGETYRATISGSTLGLGQFRIYFNFTDMNGGSARYPASGELNFPKVSGSTDVSTTLRLTEPSMSVKDSPGVTKGHLWDQFVFNVTYTGGGAPKLPGTSVLSAPKLVIDGHRSWEMLPDPNSQDFDYSNGERYYIVLPGEVIDETGIVGHTYFFTASDGVSTTSTTPVSGPSFYPEIEAQVVPEEGGQYSGFEYRVTYRDPDNDPAQNVSLFLIQDGDPSNPIFVVDFIDRMLYGDTSDMNPGFYYIREVNVPDITKYASGFTFTINAIELDPSHAWGFYVQATDVLGASPTNSDQWTLYPAGAPASFVRGPAVIQSEGASGLDIFDLAVSREATVTGPEGSQVVNYTTYLDFTVSNVGKTDVGTVTLEATHQNKGNRYTAEDIKGGLRAGEDQKRRVKLPDAWESLYLNGPQTITVTATATTVLGAMQVIASRDVNFVTGPVLQIDTSTLSPTSMMDRHPLDKITLTLANIGDLPSQGGSIGITFKVNVNSFGQTTMSKIVMNATETTKTVELTGFLAPPSAQINYSQRMPLVVELIFELEGATPVSHQRFSRIDTGRVVMSIDVAPDLNSTPEPSFAPSLPVIIIALLGVATMSYSRGREGPSRGKGARRFRALRRRREAVSPVIATILLVAITVTLVGMIYYWVTSIVKTDKLDTPKAQSIATYDEEKDWFKVDIVSIKQAGSTNLGNIEYRILDSGGNLKKFSLEGQLNDDGVYGVIPGDDQAIGFYDAHPSDGKLGQEDSVYVRADPNNGVQRGDTLKIIYKPTGEEILSQTFL